MPRMRWTNWAGNQTCVCDVETPANLSELRQVVTRAAHEGKRVRASGGGYSWSELVPTDGVIVDMRRFDHIRLLDGPSPDEARSSCDSDRAPGKVRIVEVGAGVTIQQLGRFARARGLTLVSPPLYPHPTVGGAVAVGCHGTGFATGSFCDQLRELSFVRADGSQHVVRRGERDFPAAMVALGTLGIVHSVKLGVVPQFNVHVDKRYVPMPYVLDEFDDLVRSCEFLEIFWFPFSRKMWLYIMNTTNALPDRWWGWTRLLDRRDRLVEGFANHFLPWVASATPRLMPLVNRCASSLANEVSASVQTASDAFHFLKTYPKNYDTCYAVPVEHAGEAWRRAVALVHEYTRAELYPVNLALHCRFTAGSTAWLAPNYGGASCFIEVTTVTATPGWKPFFREMEERWATLPRARPHWGKVFQRLSGLRVRYPRMADFLRVREQWDPERVFLNRFLEEEVFQLPRRRSPAAAVGRPVPTPAPPAPPAPHAGAPSRTPP